MDSPKQNPKYKTSIFNTNNKVINDKLNNNKSEINNTIK